MYRNRQRAIVVVIAAIAIVGWLIAGCGGGGGEGPATGVSGTIEELGSGLPLGGVVVTVDGQIAVSDDTDGSFIVTGVPAGTWEVAADSPFWDQVGDPPEVVVVQDQVTALGLPILMTSYGPPPPP